MTRANPLPILHNEYDVNLSGLTAASKLSPSRDTLRRWIARSALPHHVQERYFMLTMTTWGVDPRRRGDLFQCYFPDTPAHLYHLLWFEHARPLVDWTGFTPITVHRILRSPTLSRRQIRALSPQLMEYVNRLIDNGDARSVRLERSLRDRATICQ